MKRQQPSIIDQLQTRDIKRKMLSLSSLESVTVSGFVREETSSANRFINFVISIKTNETAFEVKRRYRDFDALFTSLVALPGIGRLVPLIPPKRMFGAFQDSFLRERQTRLNDWLQRVLRIEGIEGNHLVQRFLSPEWAPESSGRSSLSNDADGSEGKTRTIVSSVKQSASSGNLMSLRQASSSNLVSNLARQDSGPLDGGKAPFSALGRGAQLGDRQSSTNSLGSDGSQGPKPSLKDFTQVKVLGVGSFGKVVLVRKNDTKVLYADKVLKKKKVSKGKELQHAKTERSVLSYLDHPFLVKLHFAFQDDEKLHYVIDYVPGGELFFHLGKFGRFTEALSKFYSAEIALALGYLHSKNVIYRDLKPENILLGHDGHIKLADFGLSKEHKRAPESERNPELYKVAFSFCGTPEYLAPEVVRKAGHNKAVDWWSLGALLYEMLTGLPPWYCDDRDKLYRSIIKSELPIPKIVSIAAEKILRDLLHRDPAKRLGSNGDAEAVKRHFFFRDVDFVKLYRKEIKPPYIPKISTDWGGENPDTDNFDSCFTKMSLNSQPDMEATNGTAPPQESEETESPHFNGFTFVGNKQLSEDAIDVREENGVVGGENEGADDGVIAHFEVSC